MKKHLFLILCIILFSACQRNPQPEPLIQPSFKAGYFESDKPGYLERISLRIQGIKNYPLGDKLTLNSDSTYKMLTCSTIHSGSWWSDTSKLYLKESFVNWKLDTFRKHGFKGKWPEVSKEPLVFTIKDDRLYGVYSEYPEMIIILKRKSR